MTSTWTDIPATGAINDQYTADMFNQMAANLDFLRNPPHGFYALSTGAANITTTSTSMTDLTGFTVNITTQGKPIEIMFRCRANSTNARFDIVVDGVSISGDGEGLGAVTPASTFGNNCFVALVAVAAGAHTVKIQWRVTTGTGTVYAAGLNQLYVHEIGDLS